MAESRRHVLRTLRRAVLALTAAGVAAAALRSRRGGSPTSPDSGWRELSGPDLR